GSAFLLDHSSLAGSRHQESYGFARRADHLANFFMREWNFHPGRVGAACAIVQPAHEQARQFLAGGTRQHEGTDFAAGEIVVAAEELRNPSREFAMDADHPQQVTLANEGDVA